MPITSGFQQDLFVPNVRFELIPIKELVSSQDYQRTLSIAHIRRAVENFDLYQINPVKVSRRNGINYVFNGQHTIEIVAAASGSRDTPVWCMVYEDLTYVHEANVFADQQKFVKPLKPMETFIAHIEAKDKKYLMIQDLVHSYHLEINSTRQNGTIAAVGALEYIFDKYGYHVLDKTLRLCVGTWEGEQNSFAANILKGIARMVYAYGDLLREDIFKDRIGLLSVKQLTRTAKERRPGALGFSEAMVIQYNKRCKYRLSLLKLTSRNRDDYVDVEPELLDEEAEDLPEEEQ
ncbi:MAG: hypothetical protein IJ100_11010 [Lachnospiraceae bacterium]|nr:hypothetical protein [Lachnospiraceae bacterium]